MNQLNTEQASAATAQSYKILVAAGAGSGKSTTLVARVRNMVSNGVDPSSIAMMTFTRAGAGVMNDRLGIKVAYVGTLHAFMLKWLQQAGSVIGVASKITVIDEEESEALLDRLISEMRYSGTKMSVRVSMRHYWPESRATISKPQLIALAYHRHLLVTKTMDFDSILTFGLSLLQNLDGAMVINGKPVRHVLVDEFQDSGEMDHEIYRAMDLESLFMVGDDSQSIFGFRGARPDLMISLSARDDIQSMSLQYNYRSDQSIADAAQSLIEHNTDRIRKRLIPVSSDDGLITLNRFKNPTHEAAWLANQIIDLPTKEVAVLLRTNDLVRQYADGLSVLGVPIARQQVFEWPADWHRTRVLLSLLDDPDNDWLAARWLKLDGEDADLIQDQASAEFLSVNQYWLKLERSAGTHGLLDRLATHGISDGSRELVGDAIEESGSESISDLLMTLAEHRERVLTVGTGVHVGTIHSAKGLEFDTVVLPAFEQEVIPAHRDLVEERRLAYVAITRARHRLILTTSDKRVDKFRGAYAATLSQFVGEMGIDL